MPGLSFADMESVLHEHLDQAIVDQFDGDDAIYKRWNGQVWLVHPWLQADGLQDDMRALRGEMELPRTPSKCTSCREMFERQLDILRAGVFPGLANHGALSMSPHRKEVSAKLRELASSGGMETV